LILLRFPAACSFASFAFLAKTVAELSQNPEISSGLSQNARGLVRGAIQPLQRLAFHLRLHLRVLLEDLRIALAEELRHPLVGDAAGA